MRRPELEEQPDGSLRAVARCAMCGRVFKSEKTLTRRQLGKIESGYHVQDVLPDWTPTERELFFINAICGKCWEKMFPPEDDDEEA